MNRYLLGVSLAVAVLAGACGSSDSPSGAIRSKPSGPSPNSSPSPNATPVMSALTAQPEQATPVGSALAAQPEQPASPSRSAEKVAEEAPLTVDRLGEGGWKEAEDGDPEAAPDQRSDSPSCSYQSTALRPTSAIATGARGFVFEATDPEESITSQAFVYPSDSEAAAAFGDAQRLVAECKMWRSGGVEGDDYAFRQRQQTFPSVGIGVESVGTQTATDAPDFPEIRPARSYRVVARQGALIVVLTFNSSQAAEAVGSERVIRLAQAALSGS